jgi:hypothetical protein
MFARREVATCLPIREADYRFRIQAKRTASIRINNPVATASILANQSRIAFPLDIQASSKSSR